MYLSATSLLAQSALLLSMISNGHCAPTITPAGRDTLSMFHKSVRPLPIDDRASTVAAVDKGVSLRVMPLGASITYGQSSSDSNGYRAELRKLLVDNRQVAAVDMVGSRQHGSMADNDVEGWPGFVIDEVRAKAEAAVPASLPNLVLVNVGTNDASLDRDVDGAGARMEALLEDVWGRSEGSTVVLSTLLVNLNKETEERAVRINRQYKALAARLRARGKRVVLADMHTVQGPQKEDMADDTHPNDKGYAKMAKIWNAAIQEAITLKIIREPLDKKV